MLKSNFFSAKNFNIFYDFGRKKNIYIVNPRTDKAKKISAKAYRKSYKACRISYMLCITSLILAKKRGKSPVFRALSSSLVQR